MPPEWPTVEGFTGCFSRILPGSPPSPTRQKRPDLRAEYKNRAREGYQEDERAKQAYAERRRAADVQPPAPQPEAPDQLTTSPRRRELLERVGVYYYSVGEPLQLDEEIGHGGYAVVHACRYAGVKLAIKMNRDAPRSSASDPAPFSSARHLFDLAKESYVLSKVAGHPNIVRVYGCLTSTMGVPGILMDFCVGNLQEALLAWKNKQDRPPWTAVRLRVVRLYEQVLAALHHIHAKNVVHLDIKTNNFLVAEDHRIQLTDFGLARVLPNVEALTSVYGDAVCNHFYRPVECLQAGDTKALASPSLVSPTCFFKAD